MKPLSTSSSTLLKGLKNKDWRALAKLITYIENNHEELHDILLEWKPMPSNTHVIGITGPPGAGKSTLVDKLIKAYRLQGQTVAVLAVDPSSPFSGGAVLGDRIRMQEHNQDSGVFIRSVGSRGAHGGLSQATQEIANAFKGFNYDVLLIETVGVGQTELQIMKIAQTVLVVLVPESGDTIQAMKAGLMEIADLFVVNKADRDGADKIYHELLSLTELSPTPAVVSVHKTIASQNQGIDEVMKALEAHKISGRLKPKLNPDFDEDCIEEVMQALKIEVQKMALQIQETNPKEKAQKILKRFTLS